MTAILDFIIIFLLITAIIYGFLLNRRINLIHQSKKDLANLFRSFDETIFKAQSGIEELKNISTGISSALQKQIDKAALLADDLSYLHEKSADAANKVDRAVAAFKKIEDKLPERAKKEDAPRTIMPAQKSIIPEKPVKKSLSALLDEALPVATAPAAAEKPANTNITISAIKPMVHKPEVDTSRPKSIASALRALGYGD